MTKSMKNNKAKSFVFIMVLVAIVVLILRITLAQAIRINLMQNEASAQSTLKIISTALENYAKDNQGIFPASLSVLVQTNPQYLDENYLTRSSIKGYNYSCSRLELSGYSCSAVPIKCKFSGKKIYHITTGGSLIFEDCDKKG